MRRKLEPCGSGWSGWSHLHTRDASNTQAQHVAHQVRSSAVVFGCRVWLSRFDECPVRGNSRVADHDDAQHVAATAAETPKLLETIEGLLRHVLSPPKPLTGIGDFDKVLSANQANRRHAPSGVCHEKWLQGLATAFAPCKGGRGYRRYLRCGILRRKRPCTELVRCGVARDVFVHVPHVPNGLVDGLLRQASSLHTLLQQRNVGFGAGKDGSLSGQHSLHSLLLVAVWWCVGWLTRLSAVWVSLCVACPLDLGIVCCVVRALVAKLFVLVCEELDGAASFAMEQRAEAAARFHSSTLHTRHSIENYFTESPQPCHDPFRFRAHAFGSETMRRRFGSCLATLPALFTPAVNQKGSLAPHALAAVATSRMPSAHMLSTISTSPESREYKLHTDKKDFSLRELFNMVEKNELTLSPEYQRGFVWSYASAHKLIESVFLNLVVPQVVLHETPDGDYAVVDGKQRLTALTSFMAGEFPDGRAFRLDGLEELAELNGKGYDDLDSKGLFCSKSAYDKFGLSCLIIKHDSDPEAVFIIYERINCGALNLNHQQLRRGAYAGTYIRLLDKLARNKELLERRHAEAPDEKLEVDRQLILRFCAFHRCGPSAYATLKRPSIKKFLNQEVRDYRNLGEKDEVELSEAFHFAIQAAQLIFGENSFRPYKNGQWDQKTAINDVLFEVQMVALAAHARKDLSAVRAKKDALYESWLSLVENDERFVGQLRGYSKTAVHERHEKARQWASKLGEPRCFNVQVRKELYDADPRCKLCGMRIEHLTDAAVDHVTPWIKGGATVIDNAQLVHKECNAAKGAEY